MKYWFFALVACYFVGAASVISKANSAEKPVSTPVSPVIRLHTPETGEFFCTAVIVSPHLALTAAHCVVNLTMFDAITVRDSTGKFVTTARVAGLNERADYAIIRGNFTRTQRLKAETDPGKILKMVMDQKRQIIACGYAWSGNMFCSTVEHRHMMIFQIAGTGFMYPGMSGGPVIDVATQTVVGVNSRVTETDIVFSPIIEIYKACNVRPE